MESKFVSSTWGLMETSFEEKFNKIKTAGYDCVEMGAPKSYTKQPIAIFGRSIYL